MKLTQLRRRVTITISKTHNRSQVRVEATTVDAVKILNLTPKFIQFERNVKR